MKTLFAATACVALLLVGGCSSDPSPSPPDAAQLESLLARLNHVSPSEISSTHIHPVRFIGNSAWPTTMTACVRRFGVYGVDFRNSSSPYWAPSSPQGAAALDRAIADCNFQYPTASTYAVLRTEPEALYQYEYLRDFWTQCVSVKGVQIGTLPRRSEYLAAARGFRAPEADDLIRHLPRAITIAGLSHSCPFVAPGLPQSANELKLSNG